MGPFNASFDDADFHVPYRFRWAYCQLQELKCLDSYKPKFVKKVLTSLAPTLDGTYNRILIRIKEMYYQEALTLLCWLAYARSPPTLGELVDATITDPVEESFIDVSERGGLRDALNILAGLVTIEEDGAIDTQSYSEARISTNGPTSAGSGPAGTSFDSRHLTTNTRVRLEHFSVKEYLESDRIFGSGADKFHLENAVGHQLIAQSCLTYLRYYSSSTKKTSTEQDLKEFPLLKYAAQSWFYHSALQHDVGNGREALLLQLRRARTDWLLIHQPDNTWSEPFNRDTATEFGSAIYYASLLGFAVVISKLLESGADVNARGGKYGNALQAASYRGHRETVQLLLDRGAKVNAQGDEDAKINTLRHDGSATLQEVDSLIREASDEQYDFRMFLSSI